MDENLERCTDCNALFDKENGKFIVCWGNPIPSREFAGKVCFFAKKRNVKGCLNTIEAEEPVWETCT